MYTWANLDPGVPQSRKNNRQVTTEVATKRMGAVIGAFQGIPADSLTIARREGCVLVSWEPLCLVEPSQGGIFHIKWSDQALHKYGIDKEVATREFERLTTEAASARKSVSSLVANTQWCP